MESGNRFFCISFLLTLMVLGFLCAAFNYFIDPYAFFSTKKVKGFNFAKTELQKNQRFHRAVQIIKKKPQAIILGSSRVAAGINPETIKNVTGLDAYNSAFAGGTFYEAYHYFEHALANQPKLKLVIVGIDFFGFSKKIDHSVDFNPHLLKKNSLGHTEYFKTLLTFQSIKHSYQTWRKNSSNPEQIEMISENGLSNPLWLMSEKHNPVISNGDAKFLRWFFKNTYSDFTVDEKKIDLFKKMVAICIDKNIELKVFICPARAEYWGLMYQKGLWDKFEEFKKQLSDIHPIWDFSGFNEMTTNNNLYYEVSHFTPSAGDLVIQQMYFFNTQDFGILLTNENRQSSFDKSRMLSLDWIKQHDIATEINNVGDDWKW